MFKSVASLDGLISDLDANFAVLGRVSLEYNFFAEMLSLVNLNSGNIYANITARNPDEGSFILYPVRSDSFRYLDDRNLMEAVELESMIVIQKLMEISKRIPGISTHFIGPFKYIGEEGYYAFIKDMEARFPISAEY